jgi:hypothetical protein
MELSL